MEKAVVGCECVAHDARGAAGAEGTIRVVRVAEWRKYGDG